MGLLAGIGFLLTKYMQWDWALPVFLIGGFVVAPLLPFRERDGGGDRDAAKPPSP